MKELIKKYSHIWTALYLLLYMPWFTYLEKTVTTDYTIIHSSWDDKIPFCEYFIVPYLLWFLFVAATVVYLFFYSKEEYYRACIYLFTGMTLFLVICTIWPNGLTLRQDISYKDNVFSHLVQILYKTDTSTNVFPSLHVYNTLCCLVALFKSQGLKNKKSIKCFAMILGILIILSTMFLKQHSIWDVIGAFALAGILYYPSYRPRKKHAKRPTT